MPLVLSGGEPCPTSVPEILKLPQIQTSARTFLAIPVRILPSNTSALYVSQREAALCHPGKRIVWLGAGEATTCHIVAFRSSSSGDTLLTHLDGSAGRHAALHSSLFHAGQSASLLKLLEKFPSGSVVDVFIVGGFVDERGLSSEISSDLITNLTKCSLTLRLQLMCVGPLNDRVESTDEDDDDPIHKPRVMAAAIEIATGRFEPVEFVDRGPDLDMRIAQTHISVGDVPDLVEIFDTEAQELIFRPCRYRVLRNLIICRALPDAQLLQFFSTSPLAEGSNFCSDLRRAFDFMYNNPEPDEFFRGGPRRYRCSDDGKWTRINAP